MTKEARIYYGENTVSSVSCAGKNEIRTFPHTVFKNKLKMDERPKCKSRHHQTLRGKHKQNTLWHRSQQDPFGYTSLRNGNKNKNKQMGPNKT